MGSLLAVFIPTGFCKIHANTDISIQTKGYNFGGKKNEYALILMS
jgi:hypothetical protein